MFLIYDYRNHNTTFTPSPIAVFIYVSLVSKNDFTNSDGRFPSFLRQWLRPFLSAKPFYSENNFFCSEIQEWGKKVRLWKSNFEKVSWCMETFSKSKKFISSSLLDTSHIVKKKNSLRYSKGLGWCFFSSPSNFISFTINRFHFMAFRMSFFCTRILA